MKSVCSFLVPKEFQIILNRYYCGLHDHDRDEIEAQKYWLVAGVAVGRTDLN